MIRRAAARPRRGDSGKAPLAKPPSAPAVAPSKLVGDISRLTEEARQRAAMTVNAVLTRLYWRIGARLRTEVLRCARATCRDRAITALAEQLQRRYGRGFSENTLRRTVQLAKAFPDEPSVATSAAVAEPPVPRFLVGVPGRERLQLDL